MQYLHCLYVGDSAGVIGVTGVPTIVVGTVCLPCLTSLVESADETVEED